MGPSDHVKQANKEQRRQIEIHNWIESERAGRDVSESSSIDWANKYASSFRDWAETIPYNCINCGLCPDSEYRKECCRPFDEERLRRLKYKK